MKVFYSRVSTVEQNDCRQLQGLSGFAYVLADKCSGLIPLFERPKGKQIKKLMDEGKLTELTIHSIDRLGRDTISVLEVWKTLTQKNIRIICRNPNFQNLNDDGSPNIFSDLMISILSVMSDFEKKMIKERQTEGIAKAKIEGKYQGRSINTKESLEAFLNKPKSQRIARDLKNNLTIREIVDNCDCSISTVMKVKKALEAQ